MYMLQCNHYNHYKWLRNGCQMNTEPQLFCQTLEEVTPTPFDFESTATDHGWVMLRPFAWQASTGELSRTHRLAGGQVVRECLA